MSKDGIERRTVYVNDSIDKKLDSIEKVACIYNIHRCKVGWGIQFYDPPKGYTIKTGDDEWRKYLVTHSYYKTLEECIKAEMERLDVS
jgi:hypothetical protein